MLQAAIDLIAEGGVQAVSHWAVAARAGLPASTVGYFFAAIDDLTAEAVRMYMAREMAAYRDLAREAGTLDKLVDLVGHRAVDVRLALAQVGVYLEAARNPALRGAAVEILSGFRALAGELLQSLDHPRAAAAAPAVVALLDGFMLAQLADPEAPIDPDALIEAIRALVMGFLLTWSTP